MTDKELRDAAVVELKKTTQGYLKSNGQPRALVGAQWKKGLDLLAQIGVVVEPPPPPPPPPPGTLLDSITDFATPWGNPPQVVVNRWRWHDSTMDPFSTAAYVGTPWASIGVPAIQEVATVKGPGFRFIGPAEAGVPSGGKKVEIHDYFLTRGLGFTDEFSWWLMYPSSGNLNGFAQGYPTWNNYMAHHDAGTGRLPVWFGIDTALSPDRFYVSSQTVKNLATDAEAQASPQKAYGPNWEMNRWFLHRHQVKWSAGNDGYIKWWIDGALIAQLNGPTIHDNDSPNLQFGVYGPAVNLNEQIYADFRKYQ